jgi:hypothetical protein
VLCGRGALLCLHPCGGKHPLQSPPTIPAVSEKCPYEYYIHPTVSHASLIVAPEFLEQQRERGGTRAPPYLYGSYIVAFAGPKLRRAKQGGWQVECESQWLVTRRVRHTLGLFVENFRSTGAKRDSAPPPWSTSSAHEVIDRHILQ